MAKKESSFINMTLTLFVISAVASVCLAYVYNITKDPIQKAKDEKLKTAINIVVPGASTGEINDTTFMSTDGEGELTFYTVKVNDEIIGTAVKTFSKNGFGGLVTVMVGFDKEGKIIDSNVLEHKETPGLGDKSSKSVSSWNEQFKGMDISQMSDKKIKVRKDGGKVDAITAATITSRAYCDALQRAWDTYSSSFVAKPNTAVQDTVDKEIIVEPNMEETNNE